MLESSLHKLGSAALAVTVVAFGLLAITASAHAFGGCVDSPENPTWLLAGIGGVAAGVPWLRAKLKHRRNRRDK